MRLGIKAKQVLGVATIVGWSVVAVSALSLASFMRVTLQESSARGKLLADAIYHRARLVVPAEGDPWEALGRDPGLRSIVESSLLSKGVTYAVIVDTAGIARVHYDRSQQGQRVPVAGDLDALIDAGPTAQFRSLRSPEGKTFEVRRPLLLGGEEFGAIRIGVSTLLMRDDLMAEVRPALATAGLALLVATLVAAFFAQLILRPIHMIRGGLSRIGQGEVGVTLDLPQRDEFGELGAFFNVMSARLSAERSQLAGQVATLESAVQHLEDAVALFGPDGELLFANPAMRQALPPDSIGRPVDDVLPPGHPYRTIVEQTLSAHQSHGPVAAPLPSASPAGVEGPAAREEAQAERLVMTHAVKDLEERLVGVMLVARDLEYLGRVQSTINYSRKLVALGRLSSGVAHEVKNPLNAMTIHLELLKQKLLTGSANAAPAVAPRTESRLASIGRPGPATGLATDIAEAPAPRVATSDLDVNGALQHVAIISGEIHRLDSVVQGFLKFTRPEDLRLQPLDVGALIEEVVRVVEPEARTARVTVRADCPSNTPDVNGDPTMLRQAFLNLALNACQAMPDGGSLRIACASAPGRRVQVTFEDTGVGIRREHLEKVFDLYFTTKAGGSGIGLSMVYRIVQMHDGAIEVQSTPGRGTTFRLLLPQA